MSNRATLFAMAVVLASLITACGHTSTPSKCSVNINQLPDLRGFKLGMPLEQIWERFPGMPKVGEARQLVLGIRKGFIYNSKGVLVRDENQKPVEISSSGEIHINPSSYPDLQGILNIHLGLIDKKVASIEMEYESTHDISFRSLLLAKVNESLRLDGEWAKSQGEKERREHLWSNSSYNGIHFKSVDVSEVSCNGFMVYAGQGEVRDMGKLEKREEPSATLYPFVQLIDTEAINESKIREEEEQKKREAAREAEENKRREEFKP
jgi:hypothetical protein